MTPLKSRSSTQTGVSSGSAATPSQGFAAKKRNASRELPQHPIEVEQSNVYEDALFPLDEEDPETTTAVIGLSPVAIRLLQAASDMRESPDSYERAFLARQLIQCTFPHSDPGDVPIWSRTSGNVTLSIRPLYDEESGKYRYPYGTIPRLFLYWLVTEAARTKNRRLHLGQTYPDFMRKLGLNPTNGGSRSDSRRLRDQIERMLRATISFKQTFRTNGRTGDAWLDMQIGPEAVLWWNFDKGPQDALFESYIELSEKFFHAITSSPIPLDLRASAKQRLKSAGRTLGPALLAVAVSPVLAHAQGTVDLTRRDTVTVV